MAAAIRNVARGMKEMFVDQRSDGHLFAAMMKRRRLFPPQTLHLPIFLLQESPSSESSFVHTFIPVALPSSLPPPHRPWL